MADPSGQHEIQPLERLQELTNRNRIDFLRAELETAFLIADLTIQKQQKGNLAGATESLVLAESCYATMVRFVSDPKHSKHIDKEDAALLSAALRALREKLDGIPKPQL